jgi:hypothetical protein
MRPIDSLEAPRQDPHAGARQRLLRLIEHAELGALEAAEQIFTARATIKERKRSKQPPAAFESGYAPMPETPRPKVGLDPAVYMKSSPRKQRSDGVGSRYSNRTPSSLAMTTPDIPFQSKPTTESTGPRADSRLDKVGLEQKALRWVALRPAKDGDFFGGKRVDEGAGGVAWHGNMPSEHHHPLRRSEISRSLESTSPWLAAVTIGLDPSAIPKDGSVTAHWWQHGAQGSPQSEPSRTGKTDSPTAASRIVLSPGRQVDAHRQSKVRKNAATPREPVQFQVLQPEAAVHAKQRGRNQKNAVRQIKRQRYES